MRPAAIATSALVACLAAAVPATGDGADPSETRAAARAAYDAAEAAGRDLRFQEALARYEDAARVDPSAPFAGVARARASYLAARREGEFRPLVALERVRRDPQKLADRAAILALAREADAFPPGQVRAEARVVVGEALFRRFADPAAEPVLRLAAFDGAGDDLTRGVALSDLVSLLRARGDDGAALDALDAPPGDGGGARTGAALLPALRADVARGLRRRQLAIAAVVALAAFAIGALAATVSLARRIGVRALPRALVSPLPIAVALYLGGAGAVVAAARSDGDPRPFLLLGVGLAAVVIAARALALGGPSRAPFGAVRTAFAAIAAVAAAFLAIVGSDAAYLASFGL